MKRHLTGTLFKWPDNIVLLSTENKNEKKAKKDIKTEDTGKWSIRIVTCQFFSILQFM